VRSTIASRDDVVTAAGAVSFTTSVVGSIALQNFSGTASATATQQTSAMFSPYTAMDTTHWQWIRPNFVNASYNYCLDVSGASTASGTIVISYGCKTSGASNQNWMFTRVGTSNYFTIQPRHATSLRIDNGSSTTSGAGIGVVTGTSTTNQQWALQQVSSGVYQLVNSLSGMCLTSPSGAAQNLGQITQSPCTGGEYQQFLVSQAFENFSSCGVSNNRFVWTWTTATTGPYQVNLLNGNTSTVLAATTGNSASGVTVATSKTPGTGTYNLTFSDNNGTVVGTGTITKTVTTGKNGTTSYSCTANDLQ
jgi:hypothetical protein